LYVLPYGQMSLWGEFSCLKCDLLFINLLSLPIITRIRALKRIGPHNLKILSIIFGSLLGDSHAEYRKQGKGTRISFMQEASHLTYLYWLHNLISNLGYCNSIEPKILTRLGKLGKVRRYAKFNTWTYSSFNFIHELWYSNGVKCVPKNIGYFLTPLALSIWIMDDGSISSKGLKLSTNSFTYEDCLFLTTILLANFNIKATVQLAGIPNQFIIYIWKESMPIVKEITLPYIIPSMKYKINI
jgi:ubiquinol-cytochrome c reductase cytochrome b subunit